MRSTLGAMFAASLLLVWPTHQAWAQTSRSSGGSEGEPSEEEQAREDLGESAVTRNPVPAIEGLPEESSSPITREDLMEMANRPYPNVVYRGAELLGLEPEFVHDARQGREAVYLRDYKGAMDHWGLMDSKWPRSAIGPVGRGLVYQALMLENFDFDYEQQWELQWREARSRVDEAVDMPGNDAWDNFLLTGVIGVDAIHETRKLNFVSALTKAYEALRSIERAKEAAPDFPDLVLADGIYNYWRSVVTLSSKVLPDFEDKRAEGIAQMKYVETHGIFVSAPTTLALVFTYLEERDLKRALGSSLRGYRTYPDNVINNLVLARIYIYLRRFSRSEEICEEILVDAPDNERVHYYRALVYSRSRRMDQAIQEMNLYLSYDLIPEYRGTSLYRLAGFHYRKREYSTAEDYYKRAWKESRHKGSKRRLERMKRLKKEGKISY